MEEMRVEKINPVTLALFEGCLAAVLGLALALVVLIQVTTFGAVLTDDILQGLLFGLGTTAVSVLVVPLSYFVMGCGLGLLHALVFNAVMQATKGYQVRPTSNNAQVAKPGTFDPESYPEESPESGFRVGRRVAETFGERIPYPTERVTKPKKRA